MLELLIATLIQFSVLFGDTAKKPIVSTPKNSVTQPSNDQKITNIGSTGWDDRN